MIPVGFGGASGGYSITNSGRVALGGVAYLSRTWASGDAKTWTLSTWIKLCDTNEFHILMAGSTTTNYEVVRVTGSQVNWRCVTSSTVRGDVTANALQRDYSAWGNLVVTKDAAAGQVKFYWNGSLMAATVNTAVSNVNGVINTAVTHYIGRNSVSGGSSSTGAHGYFSDVHFIGGSASATGASFGKTDSNGVWVPIEYAGTYGTNGCKLAFGSSGALGTDTSGNGNTWTVSGSPVQTVDTPTSNYATWNAVRPSTSSLSAGNTTAAGTASGTILVSQSDKWYWEVKANAVGVTAGLENTSGTTYTQSVTNGATTGYRYTHSTTTLEYTTDGSSWSTVSSSVTGSVFPYATGASNTVNFGATAFAYAPPSGFKTIRAASVPSTAVTTSGTFTGNANADGPFVWTNGNPATLTINGNAVTFGTHADKTAGGFKLRTSSASYNTSGSNTWTATAGKRFVYSATSINTAQGNP